MIFAKALQINLQSEYVNEGLLQALKDIIKKFPGKMPIICQYDNEDAQAEICLDKSFAIKPNDEALEQLQNILGAGVVSLKY